MTSNGLPTKLEYMQNYQRKAKEQMTTEDIERRKQYDRDRKRKSYEDMKSRTKDNETIFHRDIKRQPLKECFISSNIDTLGIMPKFVRENGLESINITQGLPTKKDYNNNYHRKSKEIMTAKDIECRKIHDRDRKRKSYAAMKDQQKENDASFQSGKCSSEYDQEMGLIIPRNLIQPFTECSVHSNIDASMLDMIQDDSNLNSSIDTSIRPMVDNYHVEMTEDAITAQNKGKQKMLYALNLNGHISRELARKRNSTSTIVFQKTVCINQKQFSNSIRCVGESSRRIEADMIPSIINERITKRPKKHQYKKKKETEVMLFHLGAQNVQCEFCHAIMFIGERMSKSSISAPKFGMCCKEGLITLPMLPTIPKLMSDLLGGVYDDGRSKFCEMIRNYNSMFAFTSMGGKIDLSVLDGRGPYTFKISGTNYHRIGTLLPSHDEVAKFGQLYIHDPSHEIDNRMNIVKGNDRMKIKREVVELLKEMLDNINPYVKVYRHAQDILLRDKEDHAPLDLHIRILNNRSTDGRQYILPSSNEVAALIIGDGSERVTSRDVVVCKQNGALMRLSETHPAYMPLQYPLLFPFGEEGWRMGIQYTDGVMRGRQKRVSIREYYSFRLHSRLFENSILLQGGRLFQQYIVDSYAAIEQERLNWVRMNQKNIRSDLYQGLQDAVTAGETDAGAIGQRFVLPSSFHGGPRDMHQNYQDAIAICRWGGPPDFFITFTCNPKWIEIKEAFKNRNPEDRPDIIARVFNLKLKELLKDFKVKKIFGTVIAEIHVIEFQKRGLPHAHILLTVAEIDKPKTIDDINRIVQAEIPDKSKYPNAHQIVLRSMIHGPCGASNVHSPCMSKNVCTKRYPRDFLNETRIDENGYVQYRRRKDGQTHSFAKNKIVDNRWVVPYNIDLLTKYDAHINVEICAHPKLIKYLYKYIHKGHDRSTIIIEDNSSIRGSNNDQSNCFKQVDEIKQYLDCRYVSASEACWRIYEFSLHSHHPAIERLSFHLPDQQNITFKESDVIQDIVIEKGSKITQLLGWFRANKLYPDANDSTYVDFPNKWVWNDNKHEWTRRKSHFSIGRLYFAHPNSGERFYLRMLLNIVKGAKNFEDIKTVCHILHPTFKSACLALGLLEDDNEWDTALQESSTWTSGKQLRVLFCSLLMFCEPTNPLLLWQKHWESMSDDYLKIYRRDIGNTFLDISEDHLKNMALTDIEKILNHHGRTLKEFPQLPMPIICPNIVYENKLVRDELEYDIGDAYIQYEILEKKLNEEQRRVLQSILYSYENKSQNVHFVYGCGGTGKTFLYKVLIAKFRSEGKIVLTVASSGIAALLLPGGRTAHSRFKIPLNLHESSTCSITQQSQLSVLIQRSSLIIWDEAPMIQRNGFEAVDRTLRDLMKFCNPTAGEELFGGKTVVLGGDFRQILPVIPKSGREVIVSSSLHKSYIWQGCTVHQLTQNMRLISNSNYTKAYDRLQYIEWILKIGEGKIRDVEDEDYTFDLIEIPRDLIVTGLSSLVNSIYPSIRFQVDDYSYFEKRAILAPKNAEVDIINAYILSIFPGTTRRYYSADSIDKTFKDNRQINGHPPELLNSVKICGLPNHILDLKEGVPVMLLRNLNSSLGLCNGTRLIVHKLGQKVIQAIIITGKHIGELVLIPRINMSPSEDVMPVPIHRRQFPLKLAFAMTINKSQGQTLQKVGLYLKNPVFCHGQLYVAVSRCSSRAGLKIMLTDDVNDDIIHTRNVVYKDVISDICNSIRC